LKSVSMYPTSMKVMGVANPLLKKVTKEIHDRLRNASDSVIISLANALVAEKILECQMLAWMLLEKTGIVSRLDPGELHNLEGVLDNWVSVDTYGTLILGALWRNHKVSDADIIRLLNSESVWHRRLALVATVALNLKSRGGMGDTGRTLMICNALVEDHHDMVVKALSWALRSLIRWDKDAVSGFLLKHEMKLHKRVLREVSHKLEFGTKN